MASRKKNSRSIMLRVTPEGRFEPADEISRDVCRKRKYRRGDVVSAEIRKPRDYGQWKRAHKLGQLLAENLDDFTGWDCHRVLKRLQIETGIGCEEYPIKSDYGMLMHRVPRSLNFSDMDEGEFQELYAGFCQHVIDRYWPELTQDEIEEMAGLVGLAA